MNSPVENTIASAGRHACDLLQVAAPLTRPNRLRGASCKGLVIFALGVLAASVSFAQSKPWSNVGRDATPDEVKAWDIDVRPDFKGLPAGSGSVKAGIAIWEGKCASCHGSFGESNQTFTPLIGGTTKEDIQTGRVKGLEEGKSIVPQKTTLMKVATVSTLFDYINRAMPWNAPKSLKTDEVYAVLAYMLNLAEIVPADYTLSDKNIAEVQQRMPNRNGMVVYEPLWKVGGKGDVKNEACMKNCAVDPKVHSSLPAFARDAHGNIAEQNRLIGPVRGADTTVPPPKEPVGSVPPPKGVLVAAGAVGGSAAVKALLDANACTACHGVKNKIIGPGFNEIAAKHKGKGDLESYLAAKIRSGGAGIFGPTPMPAQPQLKEEDAQAIAKWIASGAP